MQVEHHSLPAEIFDKKEDEMRYKLLILILSVVIIVSCATLGSPKRDYCREYFEIGARNTTNLFIPYRDYDPSNTYISPKAYLLGIKNDLRLIKELISQYQQILEFKPYVKKVPGIGGYKWVMYSPLFPVYIDHYVRGHSNLVVRNYPEFYFGMSTVFLYKDRHFHKYDACEFKGRLSGYISGMINDYNTIANKG